jgi:hypothetical protein
VLYSYNRETENGLGDKEKKIKKKRFQQLETKFKKKKRGRKEIGNQKQIR